MKNKMKVTERRGRVDNAGLVKWLFISDKLDLRDLASSKKKKIVFDTLY